jgi:hypothetical protein
LLTEVRDGVVHCPLCDRITLAEAVPAPADVTTAYWSVRVHAPRVTEWGVHGPGCPVEDTNECRCSGGKRAGL